MQIKPILINPYSVGEKPCIGFISEEDGAFHDTAKDRSRFIEINDTETLQKYVGIMAGFREKFELYSRLYQNLSNSIRSALHHRDRYHVQEVRDSVAGDELANIEMVLNQCELERSKRGD